MNCCSGRKGNTSHTYGHWLHIFTFNCSFISFLWTRLVRAKNRTALPAFYSGITPIQFAIFASMNCLESEKGNPATGSTFSLSIVVIDFYWLHFLLFHSFPLSDRRTSFPTTVTDRYHPTNNRYTIYTQDIY